MRSLKLPVLIAVTAAGALLFPAMVSAATYQDYYYISVSPTSQDPGQTVTMTGNGQYYTAPFSGDNCSSTTIWATVTYYTLSGTQKTATTTMGTSDGNGDISGPVTIPADAAPTSYSNHPAEVQAYCSSGADTYLSQSVAVTVLGTVATTTTTTTSTTSTTTKAPVTTTTVPVTTTTTVPAAAPAQAVIGQPRLTG